MKYLRDLRTFPRDARQAWRCEGLPGMWDELSRRTLQRVYQRWTAAVVEQDIALRIDWENPKGVEVREWAGPGVGPLQGMVRDSMLPYFERQFAQGVTCLVAWKGDRPIGCLCYAERMYDDPNLAPLPLPDDAAYFAYYFVVRGERKRRVGALLFDTFLRRVQARGFRRFWAVIQLGNVAPFIGLRRAFLGTNRVVGYMTFRKVGARVDVRYHPEPEGVSR